MMLKKICLLSSLLLFLFAANVFAHSHLEGSTPKSGEIVTESLKTITLSFETVLEPTSSFTLLDENNTSIPLSVSISDDQLIASVENDLLNGAYTIHWKIIGEDGHPLEGDVPFTVQLPETTTPPEQSETTPVEPKTVAADTVMKEQTLQASDNVSDEPTVKKYILPGIIVLIIVVGFGSYWLIFRRKQV